MPCLTAPGSATLNSATPALPCRATPRHAQPGHAPPGRTLPHLLYFAEPSSTSLSLATLRHAKPAMPALPCRTMPALPCTAPPCRAQPRLLYPAPPSLSLPCLAAPCPAPPMLFLFQTFNCKGAPAHTGIAFFAERPALTDAHLHTSTQQQIRYIGF